MVVIPLPVAILAIVLVGEVGGKVRGSAVEDVEVGEKKECKCADRAELRMDMSYSPMLVNMACLVMLCIVGQCSKDLHSRMRRGRHQS
jgi:hypothetical protein